MTSHNISEGTVSIIYQKYSFFIEGQEMIQTDYQLYV